MLDFPFFEMRGLDKVTSKAFTFTSSKVKCYVSTYQLQLQSMDISLLLYHFYQA